MKKYFCISNEYNVQKANVLAFSIAHSMKIAFLIKELNDVDFLEKLHNICSIPGRGVGEGRGDANPGINGSGEAMSLCSGKC